MVETYLKVNMANLIIRIKWTELAEFASQMEKYKKDSLLTVVKMDLDGQFIQKGVIILEAFVMIKNMAKGLKCKIQVAFMKGCGTMISSFSNENIIYISSVLIRL